MYSKLLVLGGAMAASLLGASVASAATVDVGYCFTLGCGSITTIGTGTNSAAASSVSESMGPGNTWFITELSGQSTPVAAPPVLLNGSAIAAQTNTGGSIYLFVTATGLTGPLTTNLQSLFQDVSLTGAATLTEAAWYDPSNTAYGMPALDGLGSKTLTNFTSASALTAVSIPGTYSLTEEFELGSTGVGSVNADISINTTTPIPGTLPLFASGFAGFWAWTRKRKVETKLPVPSFT